MGLQIDRNGHNFAFVGGTGILVVLDIVALLLLQSCNIKTSNVEEPTFGADFKFSIYYTA